MTIGNVTVKAEMGASGAEATFVDYIRFTGDVTYPDGGSDANAALQAAIGKNVTAIGCMGVLTYGANPQYTPRIVHTPATVQSAAAGWPVADQDTKTIIYKLNGGAEQTLTLSGTHTTRAQLAASIEAETGLHAYDDGAQVTVKTERNGADASLEITGGTANAVYLFPTTVNEGSDDPKLMIVDPATGEDVGDGAASTDLSGYTFEAVLFSE